MKLTIAKLALLSYITISQEVRGELVHFSVRDLFKGGIMGLNQMSSSSKTHTHKKGPKISLYMQTGEEFMDDFLDKDERAETLATMEQKSKAAAVADKTSNSFG